MTHSIQDFLFALQRARVAMQRGQLKAADDWTTMAERHLRIAERHEALLSGRSSGKPKDPTKEPGYRNPVV